MKKIVIIFLAIIVCTYANVAKITALSGKVDIKRGSKYIKGTINFQLEKSDIVTTKDNSRVQILFKDNTLVSLGKNSKLDIQDYLFEDAKNSKIKLSITRGIFKFIDGKIGKLNPKKFVLKTKNATIGVRGTIGIGIISPKGEDRIACMDGAIYVSTKRGEVFVPSGMMTVVKDPYVEPTTPIAVPKNFVRDVEKNTESQSQKNKNTSKKSKKRGKKTKHKNKQAKESSKKEKRKNKNGQSANSSTQTETKNKTEQNPSTNKTATSQNDTASDMMIDKTTKDTTTTANEVTNRENAKEASDKVDEKVDEVAKINKNNNMTENFIALHTTIKLNGGKDEYFISSGSYYEISSNKNFLMDDGVLKGSDKLTKYIVYNYSTPQYIKINNINISTPPIPTLVPANHSAMPQGVFQAGERGFNIPDISMVNILPQNHYSSFKGLDSIDGGTLFYDDKQEFFIYKNDLPNENYNEELVFGTVSSYSSLPNDGISWYGSPNQDAILAIVNPFETQPFENSEEYIKFSTGDGTFVNWKDKNMLSYEIRDDSVAIALGHIKSSENDDKALVDMNYYETKYNFSDSYYTFLNSSYNEGYIFGSEHQGWGITKSVTNSNGGDIYFTHGEFRKPDCQLENISTSTGSTNLKGFANFASIGPKDIAIKLEKSGSSAGITGSIDIDDGNSINFGGNLGYDSSYITDDTFAALNFYRTQGEDGWLIAVDSGSLNSDGSNDGISWGFWGVDDSSDDAYDTGIATWVAGINPLDEITSAQNGTYTGTILGFLDNGSFIDPKNSSISLTFDFGASKLTELSIKANDIQKSYENLQLTVDGGTYKFLNSSGEGIIGKIYQGDKTAGSFSLDLQNDIDGNAHGVFKATK